MTTKRDRLRGALAGMACGDAVGTAVEFQARGSFEPLTDMIGGGVFGLQPGCWTDDTSMGLCIAESVIEKKGVDLTDQLDRYVLWADEGHLSSNGICFDIGMTVNSSLSRFKRTRDPYSGATGDRASGNGCIMRLAPIPMLFHQSPKLADYCGESARTTHGSEIAIDTCRWFGTMIASAINGAEKSELLSPELIHVSRQEVKERMTSYKIKDKSDIRATGFVLDCIEAALWAFNRTDDFESGCLLVANLGDDADTSAAVYGQIAGAYYGEMGIPKKWRDKLALKSVIVGFSDEIYRMSTDIDGPWSDEYVRLREDLASAENAYKKISRKKLPGPHHYKSIEDFDRDCDDLRSTLSGEILADFEARMLFDRENIHF